MRHQPDVMMEVLDSQLSYTVVRMSVHLVANVQTERSLICSLVLPSWQPPLAMTLDISEPKNCKYQHYLLLSVPLL